ncbi:MAG TPA: PAS domain S-box protein [Gallionella sp.]|nr:PAS domain S-box protein [Gallionella sp.]
MKLFGRVFRISNDGNPLARNLKPFLPLLLYVVVALLVAATYAISFRHIEKLIEAGALRDLGAIADAKVRQIAAWRESENRRERTFSRNSLIADEFERWMQEGAPANGRKQRLIRMLAEMQYVNGYHSIALLDMDGRPRITAGGGHELSGEDAGLAKLATDRREVVFADFHWSTQGDSGINLDLAAPLIAAGKPDRIVGAAVIRIDPGQFLYPLIQSWPIQSASAETLLLKRDGSDALFLNNVRHKQGAALSMRIPLTTSTSPCAMALQGKRQTTEGIDYRGVPVVAEMRPVPGTPWFIVSKIDREELFSPVNRLRAWSTALALGLSIIGGGLMFLWLRSHRARYRLLKEQRDAAVERELLAKHYEYLTKYANDIILVTDEAGRVIEANARALQAYGYSLEEFRQMQIRSLCDVVPDSESCSRQTDLLGEQGESRFESMTRRKDGSVFSVEVSGRVIGVEGEKYLQFIMRDISERKQADDALRRSETLLKESQQMAHIGSWELDLVENVLYWSDENYRIFEVDRQISASYETFLDIVHPDDREMVNLAYTESVKNRAPYMIVHRLLFPDQRIKYVQEWCDTYYDDDGKPLRSIGTTQDITERQLARNELRSSVETVEDLYNHAPCGYHSLDKHGVIVQINDTELEWLGYKREEVVGKMKVTDFCTEKSVHDFRDNFPLFMETGELQGVEYDFVCKDGKIRHILLSATAIYDQEGNYVMSRSTLHDITSRKLAENMLVESEERFRIMADLAPIMIWLADTQGSGEFEGCNFFNKGWHEFTGLTLEQTQGCSWLNIVHAGDRERCLDVYAKAFRKTRPFKLEYRLRHHDGKFRWVQDSGVPRFTDDGRFLGFIGTCIDTSEQRSFEAIRGEMEHAGRLNLAGEMASGLAHELSQPLTAANNYLDACLRRMDELEWDREKLQQAVKLAHLQTERAGKIIGHLKSMVRKQGHERSMTDINQVIKSAVTLLEREFQHQSVTVVLDLPALPQIPANRIEIEQVLINLMKNAVEAMAASPKRELHIATRLAESGDVLVLVRDTGGGIAADDMDKIFNPFHTSKQDGLGLGLAICRTLVENHGGRIWVEPGRDSGTDFNFTLSAGR